MIVSMMPVQLFADNSVAGEGQSNGTTQNKAVASYELNGETISFEGETIREVNTKMRDYWEVDDAHGCSYNADRLPADGTGALTWTIYGTVGQGKYLNSGALILPALSGGYIYKNGTYQWENITVVAGDKNATIVSNDTFDVDHIYVSNGANTTTTFTGITLDGSLYVVPNGTVTFYGCVFKGMLRVPNGDGSVKVANCKFVGDADEGSTGTKNEYPFFFQAGGTLEFIGNTIAANTYKRGLNVGGLTELNATIENNTIGAVTAGYSAIQLSGEVTEAKIKGNEISLYGTNAFTLHRSLISADKVTKVTVEGNTITGTGYLIYDDAAANNKAFTSENLKLTIRTNTVASTVNTTQGVKESVEYDIGETVATVVNKALTPTHVATVNGKGYYATLADAIANATPDDKGVITYEISGKAEISGADQWISFVKNAERVIAVKFVGMTEDAEISITSSGSILGVQGVDVDVSFENLTLSHPNGIWVDDLANATNYFACMVRRDGHTVTYTKCTFPNGACNNQFGKTVFNDCKFTSTTGWSLWNTSTGTSELNNCSFTGKRGIKLYAEGLTSAAGSVTVKDTTFVLNDSEKAAIEITKPGSVALDNISVSGTTAGTIKKNLTDGYKSVEKVTVTATGTGISGTFNGTTESGVAKKEFNISGGTFTSEVSSDYLADGFELKDNGNGTYGVKEGKYVAQIGSTKYKTLADAIEAAQNDDVIVVSAGEYKLNGSLTYTGKAFTIKAADGANVSFDMSNAVALHGAKITFEGVTFDYKTNGNYIGIKHADTLVYNNCTINGQVFLYATNETFNGCTFIQTSASAYNVWTYGAKNVKFNGCVFNCVGKSVLLYNEGANTGTDLTVTDTTFNASAPVAGKAAIEIDTSLMRGQSKITVDKATADKTTGFATGSNSGNSLWNDKKQTADTNQNTTVVVDGKTVFKPANFIDLDLFIKWLANNGYNVDGANYISNINAVVGGKLTVKWSPVSGCYDTRAGHICTVNNAKATGNTPKRVNSGLTQFQLFEGSNVAVTIKNVKFVYEPAAFTVCENSDWKGSFTAADAPAGQLYFMTTGDVTVERCDFEKVVFTTFNTTGTSTVNGCTFKDVYNSYAIKDIRGGNVSVTGTTIDNCGGGIMVSSTGTVSNVTITRNTFYNVDVTGTAPEGKVGTRAILQIASSGDYASTAFDFSDNTATSCGPVIRQLNATVAPVGSSLKYLTESPNSASGLYTSDSKGSKKNPYNLAELSEMNRAEYIAAQEALGGTMYVKIGDYSYGTNGVLGNGVRNDTPGQMPDHSKLNAYAENGYRVEKNDGANGKNIIFVGGSVTSGVTGYPSIDNIGTSLLLAVPAYTNVTFEGVTFNNVMSFDYQLYTSPWSQLGELKFSGCTFNGIIVGAIAAQTLTFDECEFKDYTNTISANNSNPTWIRPAYGNWTNGDNEGQGSDFKSLTTINFTNNKVTSTRPVKFERISQWDITSTVTATGNYFDITKQSGDTSIKNVGLYLGAHTDANEFHLVAANNTKSKNTAALYTIPSGKTSLPVDSTVKNTAGESIELTDALKWKATDAEKDKIVLKTVIAVASIGERRFATLEEAVAAVAKNGEEVTIKLLSNITAGGIDVAAGQNIVFDFDGHTYTLDGSMVGSTGTKTNGFRFLKGSTVVLKNGTLANGNGSPAKAMINSYATLKLVDFSVDARTTAVAETGSAYGYAALYISNGVTTVTGNGNYTTSDDNFVILIANVGDYTDGASLVFDENYTGTVSGKVSTGNKQNATVEIKNGKFDLKSIDVENTNTTVTISGGKFKNIEIAGKYLDNKAFDTEADADGYYAVMAHPITGIGLSIGEDISLRVIVRNGYQDGKLFYSYIDANGNLVEEKATIGKDTKGNYVFRIYNINPQRAGTIYTLRYEDKAGNTVGALKEASILTYLEGLYDKKIENETATKEAARKVYIANFLEYCAAAATRAYPDDESRTQAIRDLMNKLGLEVTHFTLDEDHAGETYNDNAEKVFTGLGIEYGSIMRIYYAVSEEAYNAGYVYKQAGHVISNPIEIVEGKNGKEYRLYLNIPPYEYFSGQTITVEDSEGNTICVYSCPMGRILLRFSNTEKYEEKVTSVARAAFDYCAALKAYLRSK